MSLIDRCDEIVRLIDLALVGAGTGEPVAAVEEADPKRELASLPRS